MRKSAYAQCFVTFRKLSALSEYVFTHKYTLKHVRLCKSPFRMAAFESLLYKNFTAARPMFILQLITICSKLLR